MGNTNFQIKILAILIALSWCFLSATSATQGAQSIGTSVALDNPYKVTDDPSAIPSTSGTLHLPYIYWQGNFKPFESSTSLFSPKLTLSLAPRETADGAAKVGTIILSLPATYNKENGWSWSWGVSYVQKSIKGEGGTVQLNNGTGTSTFYRPTQSSSQRYFTLDLSSQKEFGSFVYSVDLMASNLLNRRRAFSIFINLGYIIGGSGGI